MIRVRVYIGTEEMRSHRVTNSLACAPGDGRRLESDRRPLRSGTFQHDVQRLSLIGWMIIVPQYK